MFHSVAFAQHILPSSNTLLSWLLDTTLIWLPIPSPTLLMVPYLLPEPYMLKYFGFSPSLLISKMRFFFQDEIFKYQSSSEAHMSVFGPILSPELVDSYTTT
jgi:hypothetical protein